MKAGDLVRVTLQPHLYLVLAESGREGEYGEQLYKLLELKSGEVEEVRYSLIKTVNKAEDVP